MDMNSKPEPWLNLFAKGIVVLVSVFWICVALALWEGK
jgi:hypothetical protein